MLQEDTVTWTLQKVHPSQIKNTLWHSRKNLVTPCLSQSLSCYAVLTAAWQWLCVGGILGIHTPNNSALLPTAVDGTQESDHRDCPRYTKQIQRNGRASTTVTEDDSKGRCHQKSQNQLKKATPLILWECFRNISRPMSWMQAAHSELAMRYQATPVLRNTTSCFSLFPRGERVSVFCGQNTHCFLPEWVLSGKERKAGLGRSSLGRMALVQLSPWRRELFFLEQRRKKGI